MSLLSELKRRNVFRVALLYMVASWVIMQVADVGISLLGLPVTTGRLVILLLAIGFPLVMVFSWAYEITPDGLKKEKDVIRDVSVTHETAKKLDTAVIVLLLIAIGGLALDRFLPGTAAVQPGVSADTSVPTGAPDKSIAVLPFVNMSADKENEYFSDGLSEELLNLLAKIPELQVAARTSAFRFKESDADINEIGLQLNVAHVLEGSVRKSGDKIRITAQLINASNGYHLWSNTWDRTLIDVFAIQDEIAAAVVEAMKVSLLGELPTTRVTDPGAYALYLQSKAAANKRTSEGFNEATALMTQALAIDPDYAEGWVQLSVYQTNMTGMKMIPAEEGFARAAASAERALIIDPTNARALSGLGWNAMYWEWDFEKAARLITQARGLEPGNASILNAYAVLNYAFGRRESGISLYREALNLDPLAMSILSNLSGSYYGANRFDEMAALVERMRDLEPNSAVIPGMSGWLEQGRGNAETALAHFAEARADMGAWGRAVSHYDLGQDDLSDAALADLVEMGGYAVVVASIYAYRGENDKAFEWLDRGFEEHDDWMIEIRMFKYFDSLHSDPRWDAMVEKVGMTDEVARSIGL